MSAHAGGVHHAPRTQVKPEGVLRPPERHVPEGEGRPGRRCVEREQEADRRRDGGERGQRVGPAPPVTERANQEPDAGWQREAQRIDRANRGGDAEGEAGHESETRARHVAPERFGRGGKSREHRGQRGHVVHLGPRHECQERRERQEEQRAKRHAGVGLRDPQPPTPREHHQAAGEWPDEPRGVHQFAQRQRHRPSRWKLSEIAAARVDHVGKREEGGLGVRRERERSAGQDARLQPLHQLVDQERLAVEHHAGDDRVDEGPTQRHHDARSRWRLAPPRRESSPCTGTPEEAEPPRADGEDDRDPHHDGPATQPTVAQ